MSTGIIFGVSGQDGSHLSDILLGYNYNVIGVSRRSSTDTKIRIKHILDHPNFAYREGDVTDPISVQNIIREYKPDEIYALSAQSHVQTSFDQPQYTFDVNASGIVNILEAVRVFSPNSKIYFAGTSEQFGNSVDEDGFQRETTPFCPTSPYAISKLAAFYSVKLYREMYGLHASCGILFNHEGPRRGFEFITRKISSYCADLAVNGYSRPLLLGNLSAQRDWGYAPEYCNAMWLMLQREKPDDYVVATGETHSVREFCEEAFSVIGQDYINCVKIGKQFMRPSEVYYLKGDASKAERILGWKPKVKFKELVEIMVKSDIKLYSEKMHGLCYGL